MTLTSLDYGIMIGFVLISLGIGLYFSKRASRNVDSFFLGGRNMPWWLAGISMVATTFAADTPLAVTELVASSGIAGNWLWWNMLAGGMLTTFFFARYWRRAGILTDLELIELRYSGPLARFLRGFRAVYFGVFLNCVVIGWVNLALSSLLEVFFEIPQEEMFWYLTGAMVLVALYSSLSGLIGVVFTDFLQFLVAMSGCIILAVIVLNSPEIGGVEQLKSRLPEGTLNFFPSIGEGGGGTLALGLGSFLAYIGMQWWASWYPGSEPGGGGYVAQRMMSTKDEKNAIYSSLFFQIGHYALRPWPWIIVALCALVLYPDLADADKKLGYVYAMRDFLPSGLKGLLLVAFFAAYMSTISTQLNWGTSYLINDLYRRFIRPNATQKQLVNASRVGTLLVMLVALSITPFMTSVSGAWEFIIEAAAGLGLVLILRWYWWRVNAWSEIIATVAPLVALVLSRYVLHLAFPESFFFIVGVTTVSWIVVTLLTPPEDAETLKTFYERIRPDGWWAGVDPQAKFDGKRLGTLLLMWLSG
ncbi:MAG TPA: sodium:proline symporter, partial [Cytophagales bacterium]|nr:sodium:proline symporter [Cytophagales bacterium]